MALRADAHDYAKKCKQCQLFSNMPKQPAEIIASVLSPIPFAMWAVDIVGILLTSTKQAKYCIIVIDYMTKWVEYRSLATITEEAAKSFMLEHVILRFGIPKICVSENCTQFVGNKFETFLVPFQNSAEVKFCRAPSG